MTETTPQIQMIRPETNGEKIARLAKDTGVSESYIRALMAGKVLSPTKLRIATYEDLKRVFQELKDTKFAKTVARMFEGFVGDLDIMRKKEVIELLRKSDNAPTSPAKTKVNTECLSIADELEHTIDGIIGGNLAANKHSAWAAKQALDSTVKYSHVYEEALLILIHLREITSD